MGTIASQLKAHEHNDTMELTAVILLGLASFTVARPDMRNIAGVNIANDVQQGIPGQNIEGTYSWTSPEGAEFFVKWIADKNGYRVLDSNAIPIGLDGIAADGFQGAFDTDEVKVKQILGSGVVPAINEEEVNGLQSSFTPSFIPFNDYFSDAAGLDQDDFVPIIKDAIYFTYNPVVFRPVIDIDSESTVSQEENEPQLINSIINPASLEVGIDAEEDVFASIKSMISPASFEVGNDVDEEAIAAINSIINPTSFEVYIDAEPDFFISDEAFGDKLSFTDVQNNLPLSLSEEEFFPVIHNDVPTSISEEVFGLRDEVEINEISSEQ